MTEWNMTASQKKIEFFDESKQELEDKIINLEATLEAFFISNVLNKLDVASDFRINLENKLDEVIKLLKELKND
mgnify:CR=1 FL=1